MFDETIVVQSAISAFNNAALYTPAFLWWAVLGLPLFAVIYMCGNTILERIGWTDMKKLMPRCALTTVILTLCWLVLFGGNYMVLRDNTSVLPWMTAAIGFVASMFIGSHTRNIALPVWREHKWRYSVMLVAMAIVIGMSDMHAWWGPVLQISAILFGFIIGRRAKHKMRTIAGTNLIMVATVVAILMQPEFFRFGQLGGLTLAHLCVLVLFGASVMAETALHNINARNRIHHSAYVKLKWMLRFVIALGIVMFGLTESVPVFMGLMAAMFLSCALSVWHNKSAMLVAADQLFAISLGIFGIITTMPVITGLGILYWTKLPKNSLWADIRRLL